MRRCAGALPHQLQAHCASRGVASIDVVLLLEGVVQHDGDGMERVTHQSKGGGRKCVTMTSCSRG